MKLSKNNKCKAIFLMCSMAALLSTGCTFAQAQESRGAAITPTQMAESTEVVISAQTEESTKASTDEEELAATALLSLYSHLQNLEFDEANFYLKTTDEEYFFKPMKLDWANEIFYQNLSVKIKNIEVQGDMATVLVDMTLCVM